DFACASRIADRNRDGPYAHRQDRGSESVHGGRPRAREGIPLPARPRSPPIRRVPGWGPEAAPEDGGRILRRRRLSVRYKVDPTRGHGPRRRLWIGYGCPLRVAPCRAPRPGHWLGFHARDDREGESEHRADGLDPRDDRG